MENYIKKKIKKYILFIFVVLSIFSLFLIIRNREDIAPIEIIEPQVNKSSVEEVLVDTCSKINDTSIEFNQDTLIEKIGLIENSNLDNQEKFSVVVIDSGVYLRKEFRDRLILSKDFVNGKELPYDDSGHGTAVAGIISSLSNANVISLKVLDCKNEANIEDIISAFEWVIEYQSIYNIRVINISIGVKPSKETEKLKELCELAQSKGIFIVTSSGNKDGINNTFVPADYKDVIAVGSVGLKESGETYISEFSMSWTSDNGEVKPDIYAFGENIVTYDSDCLYKGNMEEKLMNVSTYSIQYGTSFSSAIVSGVICRIIQENPKADVSQIRTLLYSGERVYDYKYDSYIPLIKY